MSTSSDQSADTDRVRVCACGNGPIPDVETTCECCQRGHEDIWVPDSPFRKAGRYCWRCLTPTLIDGLASGANE